MASPWVAEGLPDVIWRSIPHEHLRTHPQFVPLPPAPTVRPHNERAVRLFEQGSEPWLALHEGRLTSSTVAAVCGLYEPCIAARIKCPKHMRTHTRALDAYRQLRVGPRGRARRFVHAHAAAPTHPPMAEVVGLQPIDDDMWDFTCAGGSSADGSVGTERAAAAPMGDEAVGDVVPAARRAGDTGVVADATTVASSAEETATASGSAVCWVKPVPHVWDASEAVAGVQRPSYSFDYVGPAAAGVPVGTGASGCGSDEMSLRLTWGRVHEATGVLAALNWLTARHTADHDSRPVHQFQHLRDASSGLVLEVGLCPFEVVPFPKGMPCTRADLPLLGASPDGVYVNHAGEVAAIEVKCHSPFIASPSLSGDPASPMFRLMDSGPRENVPPLFMPQIQLEILCLGPHCSGAYFVSLSATRGARIFFVPRNNDYIGCMFRLVAWFQRTYVVAGREPPRDFPQQLKAAAEHLRFADLTNSLCRNAPCVANLAHEFVQRRAPLQLPLLHTPTISSPDGGTLPTPTMHLPRAVESLNVAAVDAPIDPAYVDGEDTMDDDSLAGGLDLTTAHAGGQPGASMVATPLGDGAESRAAGPRASRHAEDYEGFAPAGAALAGGTESWTVVAPKGKRRSGKRR